MEAGGSRSNSPSKTRIESSADESSFKAGSINCPFKLLIVGGGPAGCSIIVRAIRLGLTSDLCGFTFEDKPVPPAPSSPSKAASSGGVEEQKTSVGSPNRSISPQKEKAPSIAGVCIVDSGPLSRFGGGRLQDYCINSNTYVNKFVTHVVEEKPDNLPPERVKGTPLERLAKVYSATELTKIGPHIGPLLKVGNFLRDLGQTVYSVVQSFPESSRSYHETSVQSIHRIIDSNGKFSKWKVIIKTSTNVTLEVYTKHVVMCTGGHQEPPIFSNPQFRSKLMLSDHVCTMEGIQEIKQRLNKNNTNISGMGRIAIIGGSHSAFSAAWICLNKLLDEEHGTTRSGLMSPSSSSRQNNNTAPPASTPTNPTATTTAANTTSNKLRFNTSGICILHRSSVKVFYGTKSEADHDNYHEYSNYAINRITGQINPFGGIRGDAKELWRAVRSSRETRVRLLQIKGNIGIASSPAQNNNSSFGGMKQSIVDKVLEEAVVIVWACGYSTNAIPIYDANDQLIAIAHSKGQVNVDDQARVLAEDQYQFAYHPQYNPNNNGPNDTLRSIKPTSTEGNVVENLYGSGLGYGLKATLDNGELDGSSGRADGVAVYLKRSATLVLSHVLGNKVFGGGNIKSWEERNTLLRKQQLMNQSQKDPQQASTTLNLTSLSMGSSSSTVGTSSSTVTSDRHSLAVMKNLASPKRPATTSQSNNPRAISTSRQAHRSTEKLSTPSNNSSNNNSSQRNGILHKSCPESFVKTMTSNNNSNTLTVVGSRGKRPNTQHHSHRKGSRDSEKISQDLKRPQSTGRSRPNQTAEVTTLMSSTGPLTEKSPSKLAIKTSPRSDTPKKASTHVTPVTSPVPQQPGSAQKTAPLITLSPFGNSSLNNNTTSINSGLKGSLLSPKPTQSPVQQTAYSSSSPNHSSYSPLPSTQKPLVLTPTKSPLHSPLHGSGSVSTPVQKSPHMPFPTFKAAATLDDRKSMV